MQKRALVRKAAVVACSVALVANPVAAIAADGASTQSVEMVATQASSQSWEIHNYDSTYTEALLLKSLKDWWPSGGSFNRKYGSYRLTSGSTTYEANTNDSVLKIPSGQYKVEGKYATAGTSWHDLGTFTLSRWWNFSCSVIGSPKAESGSTVGGVTVSQPNSEDFTFNNTGNGKIDEGVTLTVKPIQIDGYDVAVQLDGNPVALDASGTFTIAGRSGKDEMKDSRVTVTYTKKTTLSADPVTVTYNSSKRASLDGILAALLDQDKVKLVDTAAGTQIIGLTADDFSILSDEDVLGAGDHQVTLSYKGTVGGQPSVYSSRTLQLTVNIEPATLVLNWAQQLGEAPAALKDKVDGAISYGDAQTFDFAVADMADTPVTFETRFYAGASMTDSAYLGEDTPSTPGIYTELINLVDASGNYNASPISRTFAIVDAPTSVAFDEQDVHVTYDGAAHALNASATSNGAAPTSGSITYRYVRTTDAAVVYDSSQAPTDAGTYQVTATYADETGLYAGSEATTTLTIAPATLALDWAQDLDQSPSGAAYDGVISYDAAQDFDFGVTATPDAPVTFKTTFYNGAGDDKTLLGEEAPSDPGLYTQVVELADQSGNYVADSLTRTFVIDPVPTSLVFDEEDVHVTYDGAAHALETAHAQRGDEDVPQGSITYRYVRYEEGEEVYYSTVAPTDAGEYTVIATYRDETGYYAMSEDTATLTIDPRPITVKVDSLKKTEGEADPRLTFSVTEGADGWAGTDSLTDALGVTLKRDAGEAPGEYGIAFMAENGSNFDITVEPGTLTIEKKAATPGSGNTGNIGANTGSAAKPASKKAAKKTALPQTGDNLSMAAPIAVGATGITVLAAAAISRKRRNG